MFSVLPPKKIISLTFFSLSFTVPCVSTVCYFVCDDFLYRSWLCDRCFCPYWIWNCLRSSVCFGTLIRLCIFACSRLFFFSSYSDFILHFSDSAARDIRCSIRLQVWYYPIRVPCQRRKSSGFALLQKYCLPLDCHLVADCLYYTVRKYSEQWLGCLDPCHVCHFRRRNAYISPDSNYGHVWQFLSSRAGAKST